MKKNSNLLTNPKTQSLAISLLSIFLSLIAASIMILLVGRNPLQAFQALLQGSGFWPKENYSAYKGVLTDFLKTLDAMTPMLFASLSVAVALKVGLFNIGVAGQMLAGGFLATVVVGYSDLPSIVARPLVLIIGMLAGALLGTLVGYLKHRFNINEVVSTIMLNYIVQYIVSFFIQTNYVNPVSRQSNNIQASARLSLQNVEWGGYKMQIPLAFPLAILIAVLLHIFLQKTRLGFAIRVVGLNRRAAKYAGISVGKNILLAMFMSGALAGLAGASFYLGYYQSIQPRVLSSMGFDAVAVALLGNAHPLGIIFASLLITILSEGAVYMSSRVGVRQEIASLITGLVLLFSAMGAYIRYQIARREMQTLDRYTAEPGLATAVQGPDVEVNAFVRQQHEEDPNG